MQKETSKDISRKMFPNTLIYNMGRVVSYTIIGSILGVVGGLAGIGGSLQSSSLLQGSLKLFAGIVMIIMGVNMLGIFPGLRACLKKYFRNLHKIQDPFFCKKRILFLHKIRVPVFHKKLIPFVHKNEKKVIFTMGKGGVGKTTIAIEIAKGLIAKGRTVHLTTTDSAGHMSVDAQNNENIEISNIDEKEELKNIRKKSFLKLLQVELAMKISIILKKTSVLLVHRKLPYSEHLPMLWKRQKKR